MCGIAGYSLPPRSRVERTLAAQALLAAIAERGTDAVGYAYRTPAAQYATVVKQRTPASQLLDRLAVPDDARQLLVHVRDFTKGCPSISANNHPIRHGPVIGIHNGIIANDEEILAEYACARSEPEMTVDSEAIFALAAHSRSDPQALEEIRGSMATAWLDERERSCLYVARGVDRPLWLGESRNGVFFGSTELVLEVVERFCGLRLRKREVAEGTLLTLAEGKVTARRRFRATPSGEESSLPAVRSAREREACLRRLATIAAV
jgi:glucosamine 6-phosphate synthetase-like amidotransferase/phosphosugar isomerase protein